MRHLKFVLVLLVGMSAATTSHAGDAGDVVAGAAVGALFAYAITGGNSDATAALAIIGGVAALSNDRKRRYRGRYRHHRRHHHRGDLCRPYRRNIRAYNQCRRGYGN